MSKEIEYAYAAGLIDGEGTITLGRMGADSPYRRPVVSIPSTTPELLTYMHTTFKGCVSNKRPTKTAETPSKTWQLTNNAALEFLRLVSPYLKEPEKYRRAQLLLSEYKSLTLRNGRYNEQQRSLKLAFERRFFEESLKPNRDISRIRW